MVLAAALLSVPVMAQGIAGDGGVDVLGTGIFETTGSAFKFPEAQDTNIDTIAVGNDKAISMGEAWPFPFTSFGPAVATNNLEVKKNQDSGECACCKLLDPSSACKDCCVKLNMEQIKVGNREALAFGFAVATNNIKVVTNQQ